MENVLFMKNMIKQSTSNFSPSILESLLTTNLENMENSINDELEKVFESKFFCPSKFAQEIEKLVQTNGDMNYIDAVIHFCEMNNIDLDSVSKLISKPLKEKIKYEAMELNFLKRTSRAKLVF